eukprot:TRINITY_DN4650_c0_g1_i1.p1 TRINITY_DN4650_c0_g1~~TRINITY_DN4650_c0_g1_i1.p1  ORF type:complete len:350 (+),score=64.65 TRINITY_DN4650_c0_g1_i1:68-1051(+)
MSLNLRVRSTQGVVNLRGLSPSLSFGDLKERIARETSIASNLHILKSGFPPRPLTASDASPISQSFQSGDTITLEKSLTPVSSVQAQSTSQPTVSAQTTAKPPVAKIPLPTLPVPSRPGKVDPVGGSVMKRVQPDDNSCLFHSLKYALVLEQSIDDLRGLVATVLTNDPINYPDAMLEKPRAQYLSWIRKETAWGGSVELSIFADLFQTEIMAFDVTRKRGNCFGEGKGFSQRVYFLYDGIHYDVLTFNLVPDTPLPDFDVKVFDPNDSHIEGQFSKLVAELHSKGQFVDEYNYSLKCGQCGSAFVGNKEAVAHSKSTGHTQFEQSS